MRVLIWVLIGVILSLGGVARYLVNQNAELRVNNIELKQEIGELNKNLTDFNLKLADQIQVTNESYSHIKAAWKTKLDSVLSANKIKIKQTESATITTTNYVDTVPVNADIGLPVKMADLPTFRVPVSYTEKCWSIKGEVISIDPSPQFTITERKSNNSIQQVITLPRKILFGLITIKKGKYRVFSDCGEPIENSVTFIK